MSEGKMQWELGLDSSGFYKHINGAKNAMHEFGKEAKSSILAPVVGIVAAVGSVGAVMEGVKKSLDLGAEMQDLSERTGLGVGALYMLRRQFKDAGVDSEKLGSSINKMQKQLAIAASGGQGASLLKALKLNPKQLAGEKPEEAFHKIGEAIMKLKNPTQRVSAAMQLFGKSGGEMLQVFSNPDFKNAGEMSKSAQLLEQNAKAFKEAEDHFRHIGEKTNGFFIGFSSSFIKDWNGWLKSIDSIDLTGLGQKLGNVVHNFSVDFKGEFENVTGYMLSTLFAIFDPSVLKGFGAELIKYGNEFGDIVAKAIGQEGGWSKSQNALGDIYNWVVGKQHATEDIALLTQQQIDNGGDRNDIPEDERKLKLYQNRKSLFAGSGRSDIINQNDSDLKDIIKKLSRDKKDALYETQMDDVVNQNKNDGKTNTNYRKESDKALDPAIKSAKEVLTQKIKDIQANYPVFNYKDILGDKKDDGKNKEVESNGKFNPADIGMGKTYGIVGDSLAKIGGGGNATGGKSDPLLDVQKQTLTVQKQVASHLVEIRQRLPTSDFYTRLAGGSNNSNATLENN